MRTDGRSLRKRKTYDQKLHEIRDFFARARAYSAGQPISGTCGWRPCAASLLQETAVPQGRATLFVHANDAKQIAEVIRFKRAEDLERVVLVGGLDSWMMADPLARKRHRCDGDADPLGAALCRGRHRPALQIAQAPRG